ncbi:RNA-binding protein lark [Bienertia sinuspersici]
MEARQIETNTFSFQFFHWKDKQRVIEDQPWHFNKHALCLNLDIERSLRIRILLDVRKPLKDHINLKVRGGKVLKVQVKYERFPLLCFVCGCIGHNDKECNLYHEDADMPKKFDISIRASWKGKASGARVANNDNVGAKKRLFVAKPKTTCEGKESENKGVQKEVVGKLDKLGAVVLDLTKVVTRK